jgi:hypothetical protein
MRRRHLLLEFCVCCLLAAAILPCLRRVEQLVPACLRRLERLLRGTIASGGYLAHEPAQLFADPWWYGQRSDSPYREPRWQGNAPKPKDKAQGRKGSKAKSAKANAASSR